MIAIGTTKYSSMASQSWLTNRGFCSKMLENLEKTSHFYHSGMIENILVPSTVLIIEVQTEKGTQALKAPLDVYLMTRKRDRELMDNMC